MANALIDLIMQSQRPEHQDLKHALLGHMMSQNVVYEEPTQRRWTPPWQATHPTVGQGAGNYRGDRQGPEVTRGLKQALGSQQGVNYGPMSNPLPPMADQGSNGYSMSYRPEGEMTQDDWRKVISDWYQNRVQGMR